MSEKSPHPQSVNRYQDRNNTLVDKERVLAAQTPLQEWDGLPASELALRRTEYDSDLIQVFTVASSTSRNPNASVLSHTFLEIARDLQQPQPGNHADGVFSDKTIPIASHGSRIVANIQDPTVFIEKMRQEYRKRDPSATPDMIEELTAQTKELAAVLYGKRYEEYEQQLNDLQIDSLESEPNAFDKRNREIDKEILSGSKGFVARIDYLATSAANIWKSARTTARNIMAAPGKFIHGTTKGVSDYRLARKQRELGKKQLKVRDDTNLRGVDKLVNNHRKKVAEDYAVKVEKYKSGTADPRTERYKSHINKMNGRTAENIGDNLTRDEAFIERRQAAEARKIIRKELKDAKVGPLEKRKIMASFPAEKLQRIGRAHCLETAAENALHNAKNKLRMSEYDENKLTERESKLSADSQMAVNQSNSLKVAADKIESVDIPAVKDTLQQASEDLEKVDKNRKLPVDDPDHLSDQDYAIQYAAAKNRFDEIAGDLAMLNGKLLIVRASQEERKKRATRLSEKAAKTRERIEEQKLVTADAKVKAEAELAARNARSESLKRVIDRTIT